MCRRMAWALLLSLVWTGFVIGQVDTAGPAEAPAAEAPATDAPETQTDAPQPTSAQPSAQAEPIVNAVVKTYQDLQTLTVAGSLRGEFNVQGEQNVEQQPFTASYRSPMLFRHELTDALAVGSTGETFYVHGIVERMYDTAEVPDAKKPMAELPHFVGQLLTMQNPSLMLAVSSDPRRELLDHAVSVDRGEDVEIDGKSYQTLDIRGPEGLSIALRIDPQSNLIRQAIYDMRPQMEQAGAVGVTKAMVTIDYTQSTAGAAVAEDAFAWTAPADARSLAQLREEERANNPARQLEGQPAPAFSLKVMDSDENVALADLKGSVVLLDFWATWCGPCIAAMPHLQTLDQKYADKGLRLYTINLRESEEQAKQFMVNRGFNLKVLMDRDGETFQKYKGQGIPYQILIGRDGVIRRVSAGITPDGSSERAMEEAIEAALAEKKE